MCGRYSIVINEDKLRKHFGEAISLPPEGVPENYNVAPTQSGLVLTNQQPDRLSLFRWGLVPFWAQELKIGARMINARSEGIASKPSFREAIRKRRCLVLADSFYEWQRKGKNKQPYRIFPANEGHLLVMAGIWERWHDPQLVDAAPVFTFSIITTAPNAEMSPLHNRMPALLSTEERQSAWLDNAAPLEEVLNLLDPAEDGSLQYYPVGKAVGNVRNNGPALHKQIAPNDSLD